MRGRWLSLNEEVFDKEKRRALRTMGNGLDMAFVWIGLIELAVEINDNGLSSINEVTDNLNIVFSKLAEPLRHIMNIPNPKSVE